MSTELTYNEYLQEIDFLDKEQNENLKNILLNPGKWPSNNYEPLGVTSFVIDYSQKAYLHLGNNIGISTGYYKEIFIKEGIKQMNSICHPEDFSIFNQKIFPAILKFFSNNKQLGFEQVTFSFNFRIVGKNKTLTCFWQQCKFLVDSSTRLPLFCFGSISDITGLKRGNSIVFIIEEGIDDENAQKKLLQKMIFTPNEEDLLLTKKEREIVDYLAKGLSTKQISDKTGLCKNTIKNHRQNMMQKTNSKNTVELVAFAIRNRII